MKKFCIIVGLLSLSSVVPAEFNQLDSSNSEINRFWGPAFTGCGGLIPLNWNDATMSAYIDYTSIATNGGNEFCVWTVLADDSVGSVLLQFDDKYTNLYDGIVVYTWKDFNLTARKIPHGISTLEVSAQTFAVAFSSDNGATSESFTLQFTVKTKPGTAPTSPQAYFSTQDKGELNYPRDQGLTNYANNKQVSVVLHGPVGTPRETREYRLRDVDIEENHDFVDIYVLWPYMDSYAPHYKFIGRFSGEHVGIVEKSRVVTWFPILYIFSSDRKGTGKGFTLTWETFSDGFGDKQTFTQCT